MVLYDQQYNFVGISSETLSYLGYEDLDDFTSQHSDFASLLVNKEGYIFKFKNFSWIDFILYSGSPNKSAILKMKNSEEIEIKLSVKEVHLVNPISGNEKFYSVRILSDNFVNIASKTDASITKKSPPKNSFDINNLMNMEAPQTTMPTIEKAPIVDEPEIQRPQNKDFVLNFPTSTDIIEEPVLKLDLTQEEEKIVETQDTKTSLPVEEFKLNLGDDNTFKVEPSDKSIRTTDDTVNKENTFLKKHTQTNEEASTLEEEESEHQEIKLDFLKKNDTKPFIKEALPSSGFTLKNTHDESQDTPLDLNIIKDEDKSEKVTLNFLQDIQEEVSIKEEDAPKENFSFKLPTFDEVEEVQEPSTTSTNLSFLQETQENDEPSSFEGVKKEQIIAQIKSDIQEIDTIEPLTHNKEETNSYEELKKEAQILDIDSTLFNQNETSNEKKSFTKTLKSLFVEKEDEAYPNDDANRLNEAHEEPAAKLKSMTHESYRFPSLTALGLEKEEEDDLITEFIHDTRTNIALFIDYKQNEKHSQAEYALVKMQSSADILNLNDIIITLSNIKQASNDGDNASTEALIKTLEGQINTLESYLESETV